MLTSARNDEPPQPAATSAHPFTQTSGKHRSRTYHPIGAFFEHVRLGMVIRKVTHPATTLRRSGDHGSASDRKTREIVDPIITKTVRSGTTQSAVQGSSRWIFPHLHDSHVFAITHTRQHDFLADEAPARGHAMLLADQVVARPAESNSMTP